MLNISGDDDNIWIACRVHFYVESFVPGKYIRETTGQRSVEVIQWDSKWILGRWFLVGYFATPLCI